MENNVSATTIRKGNALLLLPVLIIPFLTLGFWALGGGKSTDSEKRKASGLNLELPNAYLKNDAAQNKLRVYEEAEADAAKREAQRKTDPMYQLSFQGDTTAALERVAPLYNPAPPPGDAFADPNEEKVYRKLAQLNNRLHYPTAQVPQNYSAAPATDNARNDALAGLENVAAQKSESAGTDLELQELNGMMDKILEIQHPERTRARIGDSVALKKEDVYVVQPKPGASVGLLGTADTTTSTLSFYGLEIPTPEKGTNTIGVITQQTQIATDGSLLKLRLLDDIAIAGRHIPKGAFVYGKVALGEQRLYVSVTSVRYQDALLSVQLEAYDLDGLRGINVPASRTNKLMELAGSTPLPSLQLASLDPSLKAQAASAGIGAAKSLLTKKAKHTDIYIKGGYKLLLKNKNDK